MNWDELERELDEQAKRLERTKECLGTPDEPGVPLALSGFFGRPFRPPRALRTCSCRTRVPFISWHFSGQTGEEGVAT